MQAFFEANWDYATFVYGLAFVHLAVQTFLSLRLGDRRLAWSRLSVFAVVRGLSIAAVLVVSTLPVYLTAGLDVYAILVVLSGVALLEFDRVSERMLSGTRLSPWLLALPLGLVALGSLRGALGVTVAAEYLLQMPGALWGAWLMWRLARRERPGQRRPWFVAAAAFAVYAVPVPFALVVGPFSLIALLQPSAFFVAAIVPAELLRAAAIVVLSAQILTRAEPLSRGKSRFSLSRLAPAVFPLLLVVGLIVTSAYGVVGDRMFERDIIARTSAFSELMGDVTRRAPTGAVEVDALRAARHLKVLRETNPDVRDVFVVGGGPHAAPYVADVIAAGEDPATDIRDLYRNSSEDIGRVLRTGQPVVTRIERADGSVLVMALEPVRAGGVVGVSAVLAVEFNTDNWRLTVARYRFAVIAGAFFLFLLTILYFASLRETRGLADHIAKSEGQFRAIFENAPEAVFISDASSGSILAANPYAAALLGREDGSLVGLDIRSLLDPSCDDLGEHEDTALRLPSVQAYRRSDGTCVDVEVTEADTEYAESPAVLSFVRDVSDRSVAEREVVHRMLLERTIAEVSGRFVGLAPADAEAAVGASLAQLGQFCGAKRAFALRFSADGSLVERTFAWAAEGFESSISGFEGASTGPFDWVMTRLRNDEAVRFDDVSDLPAGAAQFAGLFRSQGVESMLLVPMLYDGELSGVVGLETVGRQIRWSDDALSLMRLAGVIFSSALGRARIEDELRKLSAAIELSPVGVIITDADNVIEYVNEKLVRMSGYGRDEVVGHHRDKLDASRMYREAFREAFATAAAGGEWQGEFELSRKNGEKFWVSEAMSAIRDSAGRVLHFVTTVEDVTAFKAASEELEHAKEQAEAANEAKTGFLASMSHEIRTPMNAIVGMGELLADTHLDTDQARYVRIMTSAGESLLHLINAILDISKIESGEFNLDDRAFDVTDVFLRTCEVVEVSARAKGLTLKASVGDSVPQLVRGDPDRFAQVLVNLLGNAVKFTDSGGVSASLAADPANPDMLRFSVADTGVGIPPEKSERIFGRFAQADSSISRRFGGTGLGLAISKSLVELMGGTIIVSSEPGAGSVFTVTVCAPATTASADDANAKRDDAALDAPEFDEADGRVRILVADDSEDNQMLIEHFLADGPFDVEFVDDGAGAVERATDGANSFDLVLMDVQMPVVDGLSATRSIRSWEATNERAAMPIVALTAYALKDEVERTLDAGFTAHVSKPVKKAVLLQAVRRYARRHL